MELKAIIGILQGIVNIVIQSKLLNPQQSPTIPNLCANYADLEKNEDIRRVLTSTKAIAKLDGKEIPQLCTDLNTEFKKAISSVNVPQLLLQLKVLKPFVKLPDLYLPPVVRSLVNVNDELTGLESFDDFFKLEEDIQTKLMSLDKDAFTGVLEGIGLLPDICADKANLEAITQLLKLIKSTSMATVCGYVKDVAVLGKNIDKLGKMDPSKLIPRLYLALNVLAPFMKLPGFNDILRGHMVTLQTLRTLKLNSDAFKEELQQTNVQAAAAQLAEPEMLKYFAEVIQGVAVMVQVCPNKKYSKYESLLKLAKGNVNTVKDLCDKVDLDVIRQISQTSFATPSFRRSFVESVVYHIVLVALVKLIV